MDLFKIEFKSSTAKDIRKIHPNLISNIIKHIESLSKNPFPRESLKLSGTGGTYRLRVGDYRVIYKVDTASKTIVIYYIRHRKKAYRKL